MIKYKNAGQKTLFNSKINNVWMINKNIYSIIMF